MSDVNPNPPITDAEVDAVIANQDADQHDDTHDDSLRTDAGALRQPKDPKAITLELEWTGGSYSHKAFRIEFWLLVLLTIVFYYLGWRYGATPYKWLQGMSGGHFIFYAFVMLVPIILWIRYAVRRIYSKTITYKLDRESLISTEGFFNRQTDTQRMIEVNDVRLKQSLLDEYVRGGIGDIIIFSSDQSDPEFTLKRLDNVKVAFKTLSALVAEYATKRGNKVFR